MPVPDSPSEFRLRRRSFLAVALAVPALAACSTATTSPATRASTTQGRPTAPPKPALDTQKLDSRLAALEQQYNARVGVAVDRPSDGAEYRHRGDETFAHCSTFKVYAASALLRLVAAGSASLDTTVVIDAAAVVANSPVTAKAAGSPMSMGDLCLAALTQSDNTAGNYLLHAIGGPPAITAFARSVGDTTTRGDRFETDLNTAIPGDLRDTSTPAGLAAGFGATILGDGLQPDGRAQLQDWMRRSLTSAARIRAGLPQGWTSADKTGSGDYATVNDAGVVWDPAGKPVVVAILTTTRSGRQDAPADGKLVVDITAAIIETFGVAH
ncbi:class A beta-lactamase [Antrihabitans cavernicola]|uniref:Beta-lactamase n=1 Tax=Antrihabitans cavernicola TaxID=2495913 RepID=A0A5A7S5U3_9NOCA|nr:class A beta-lactamase [Spelaeibacter cavernicola]KAA0020075.1 class A beta-lactamase [Spelaeibacter cavernicola]